MSRCHFFRLVMGLLCFVSSRKRVRRTLNDFYSPSFLPEAMVKLATRVNGHLVAFLEVGIHLFECNLLGHICL